MKTCRLASQYFYSAAFLLAGRVPAPSTTQRHGRRHGLAAILPSTLSASMSASLQPSQPTFWQDKKNPCSIAAARAIYFKRVEALLLAYRVAKQAHVSPDNLAPCSATGTSRVLRHMAPCSGTRSDVSPNKARGELENDFNDLAGADLIN